MNTPEPIETAARGGSCAPAGSDVLAATQSGIYQVAAEIGRLRDRCEKEGHSRIGHELRQVMRCLAQTDELIRVYRSGEPLPTLEQVQAIFKQQNIQ